MRTVSPPPRCASHGVSASHGFALVAVLFLVLVLGGLSLGLLQEGMAAKTSVQHHESNYYALEVLEAGVLRAEMEIIALKDAGTDGIGFVSGSLGGGDYEVTAAKTPINRDRWILTSKGTHLLSTRRIEVCVRRREPKYWTEGLFSKGPLSFNGQTVSDSYNSSVGPYSAQNRGNRGDIGSNGSISLTGSAVEIHGNAIPGPLQTVATSGQPLVTGDRAPREVEITIPDTPISVFQEALGTNANGSIGGGNGNGGGGGSYNPATMALNVTGNLTLTSGTYFFTSINMTSQSTLTIAGDVKIYATGNVDLTGGSLINAGSPSRFQVFAHPYALPAGRVPPAPLLVRLRGQSATTMALYAPAATLDVGGGSELFGSAVVNRVVVHGASAFHYDESLGVYGQTGPVTLERLWWRELSPPRR